MKETETPNYRPWITRENNKNKLMMNMWAMYIQKPQDQCQINKDNPKVQHAITNKSNNQKEVGSVP